MSLVLFALVLWLLASVPFALFFGAVCRLSEWPFDADAEHIARKTAQRLARSQPHSGWQATANRGAALRGAHLVRT